VRSESDRSGAKTDGDCGHRSFTDRAKDYVGVIASPENTPNIGAREEHDFVRLPTSASGR
jgi:hypothetical protein